MKDDDIILSGLALAADLINASIDDGVTPKNLTATEVQARAYREKIALANQMYGQHLYAQQIKAAMQPGWPVGVTMASTGTFPQGVVFASSAYPHQVTLSSTAVAPPVSQAPSPQWHTPFEGIKSARLFLMEYEGTEEFTDNVLMSDVLGSVVDWLNDKDLMKYSRHREVEHSIGGQRKYLLDNYGRRNLLKGHPPKYWFIFRSDEERQMKTDKLIGTITRTVVESPHHLFEKYVDIGILLGAERGMGYATEAMSTLINWHSDKGFRVFQIGTDEHNQSMIKLAESCGFQFWKRENGNVYMRIDLRIDSAKWTGKNAYD